MKDVLDRIDAWLEGDLSGDADKTLRDARNEIIALRAKLEYVESRFCSLPRLSRQPDWMPHTEADGISISAFAGTRTMRGERMVRNDL